VLLKILQISTLVLDFFGELVTPTSFQTPEAVVVLYLNIRLSFLWAMTNQTLYCILLM
jgi:hypothetical protein